MKRLRQRDISESVSRSAVLSAFVARPFRFHPPALIAGAMVRDRLLDRLTLRWDRRVTSMVGGAGFGKTVLLSMSLERSRGDGRASWLSCEPGDEIAEHFTAGLAAVLDLDEGATLDDVLRTVWMQAPTPVCFVLDDVHEMSPGSGGAAVLARPVAELPRNGHLVLMRGVAGGDCPSGGERAVGEDRRGRPVVQRPPKSVRLRPFAASTSMCCRHRVGGLHSPNWRVGWRRSGGRVPLGRGARQNRAAASPRRCVSVGRRSGRRHDRCRHRAWEHRCRGSGSRSPTRRANNGRMGVVASALGAAAATPHHIRRRRRGQAVGALVHRERRGPLPAAVDLLCEAGPGHELLAVVRQVAVQPGLRMDAALFGTCYRALPVEHRQAPAALLAHGFDLLAGAPLDAVPLFVAAGAGFRKVGDVEAEVAVIRNEGLIRWWGNDIAGLLGLYQRAVELAAAGSESAAMVVAIGDGAIAHLGGDSHGTLTALAGVDLGLAGGWAAPIAWLRHVAYRRRTDRVRPSWN